MPSQVQAFAPGNTTGLQVSVASDDRVELLDGVIVAMAPQNPAHAGMVGKLALRLGDLARSAAFARV